MKRLTLNQARVLLSAGNKPTTQLRAARQLAECGVIEITGNVWVRLHKYDSLRLAATFSVTEYGREMVEMTKHMRGRAR